MHGILVVYIERSYLTQDAVFFIAPWQENAWNAFIGLIK